MSLLASYPDEALTAYFVENASVMLYFEKTNKCLYWIEITTTTTPYLYSYITYLGTLWLYMVSSFATPNKQLGLALYDCTSMRGCDLYYPINAIRCYTNVYKRRTSVPGKLCWIGSESRFLSSGDTCVRCACNVLLSHASQCGQASLRRSKHFWPNRTIVTYSGQGLGLSRPSNSQDSLLQRLDPRIPPQPPSPRYAMKTEQNICMCICNWEAGIRNG